MEDSAAAADYVPLAAGNRVRRLKSAAGKIFVYGKSPAVQQRLLFDQIAASLQLTSRQLAARSDEMDFEQMLAVIRGHQERQHAPSEVLTLLDAALSAHKEEDRERRLRQISYNQPPAITSALKKKRKASGRFATAALSHGTSTAWPNNSIPGKSKPAKHCDEGEFARSFLAEDDTEFMSSLREQPLEQPDAAASRVTPAEHAPSPPKLAKPNGDSEFLRSFLADGDTELVSSLQDPPLNARNQCDDLTGTSSALKGDKGVARRDKETPKRVTIPTKPAPAGQTYRRMALASGDQKVGSHVPTRTVETIDDIFDDGEDSADFRALLDDFARPAVSSAIGGRNRSGSLSLADRDLSGSDLLDQIFS